MNNISHLKLQISNLEDEIKKYEDEAIEKENTVKEELDKKYAPKIEDFQANIEVNQPKLDKAIEAFQEAKEKQGYLKKQLKDSTRGQKMLDEAIEKFNRAKERMDTLKEKVKTLEFGLKDTEKEKASELKGILKQINKEKSSKIKDINKQIKVLRKEIKAQEKAQNA